MYTWSTDDGEEDTPLCNFNDRFFFLFMIHKRVIHAVFVFVHKNEKAVKIIWKTSFQVERT